MLLDRYIQYMHQLAELFWVFMHWHSNTVEEREKSYIFKEQFALWWNMLIHILTYITGCGFACIISPIFKYTAHNGIQPAEPAQKWKVTRLVSDSWWCWWLRLLRKAMISPTDLIESVILHNLLSICFLAEVDTIWICIHKRPPSPTSQTLQNVGEKVTPPDWTITQATFCFFSITQMIKTSSVFCLFLPKVTKVATASFSHTHCNHGSRIS